MKSKVDLLNFIEGKVSSDVNVETRVMYVHVFAGPILDGTFIAVYIHVHVTFEHVQYKMPPNTRFLASNRLSFATSLMCQTAQTCTVQEKRKVPLIDNGGSTAAIIYLILFYLFRLQSWNHSPWKGGGTCGIRRRAQVLTFWWSSST